MTRGWHARRHPDAPLFLSPSGRFVTSNRISEAAIYASEEEAEAAILAHVRLEHLPFWKAEPINTERYRMNKIIRLGTTTIGGRSADVFCRIHFAEGRLSITGVEGPMSNGDALGGCGQIETRLRADAIKPAPGWTTESIARFLDVWREWHLNDMRAGTPAQRKALKDMPPAVYPVSHYDAACAFLAARGLNPDNGYHYGSAWLRVDVPPVVLAWLDGLPDADKTPAWV